MNSRQVRITTSIVGLLAILLGMDGPPGCAGSHIPLSDRDAGFTEQYLIGRWHDLEVSDSGDFEVGQLLWEISLLDNGDLQVLSPGDESEPDSNCIEFTGFSSAIGAKKYLNLYVDASNCDEEGQAEMEQVLCRYFIFQYATFLPRDEAVSMSAKLNALNEIADWEPASENDPIPPILETEPMEDPVLTKKILSQAETFSGRLLFYSEMDNDFVERAIADETIKGTDECKDCAGACILDQPTELRAFIRDNEDQLYAQWEWLIREP
jgi:hypothetical protein